MLLGAPAFFALLIGLIVWLATASVFWSVIVAIIVLLLAGGGFYSRRW